MLKKTVWEGELQHCDKKFSQYKSEIKKKANYIQNHLQNQHETKTIGQYHRRLQSNEGSKNNCNRFNAFL